MSLEITILIQLLTILAIFIYMSVFHSVQFSRSVMSNSLRLHELQHARPPCPSPTPTVYSNSCPSVMPSNHLILCCPLILLPSIFPSSRVFSNESVLGIKWPKVLEFKLQHQSFQWIFRTDDGLVGSPCSPRDSQESSPIPQFQSIPHSAFFIVHLSHP